MIVRMIRKRLGRSSWMTPRAVDLTLGVTIGCTMMLLMLLLID